jgi:hypothetical protein
VEEQIKARLMNSSAVTALAGDRIEWGGNLQGSPMPRVALFVVSDVEGVTIDAPDGMSQGRIQLDCYGATYSAAKALARAVRAALHGYAGGGLQLVSLIAARDTREGGTNEADRPFRCSLDFATFFNPVG